MPHDRWKPLQTGTLLAILSAAALPPSVAAQACSGTPTRDGELAFMGARHARGVTTSYSGHFQANLGGTLSLGTGFAVDTFDDLAEHGFTSHLSVAKPLEAGVVTVCPIVGLEYSELALEPTETGTDPETALNSIAAAPGVGVGSELSLFGDVSVVVHVRPTLLLVFGEHDRVRGGRGSVRPDGSTHGAVAFGAHLRLDRLFVGAQSLRSTLSGTDSGLVIQFGILR